MKKISVELLCDDLWTADSLHELGTNIENGDFEFTEEPIEITGDHYTAEVKLITC